MTRKRIIKHKKNNIDENKIIDKKVFYIFLIIMI